MQVFLFVIVGLISGGLGAMVGLGGGVIIVPALTLFCGVPIRQAIAASLVAVIATSITAAIGYVREGFANIRLGMTLEISTSIGGMLGGLTAAALNREVLSGIFGVALGLISGYLLVRHRIADSYTLSCEQGLLGGCYYDPSLGK
ncbi:MAG: sulfite exporter TauE/SafE family protein, partial [Chloroflexi bacterium]